MSQDATFYAAAIPAVTLLGLSKGGFAGIGMLALPLMALAISPVKAAAIMIPILLVQDALGVWMYRKTWDTRNLLILLPGAALGVFAGYILAARVSTAAVSLALGVISVLFALHRLRARKTTAHFDRSPLATGLVCGTLSGFTSMIAHAGTPPFQFYVLPQRLQRDIFVGTSVIFFAAVNWMKLVPYHALGEMTRENLLTSLGLFPLALVSTWLGVLLVRRFSAERLTNVLYILLLLVSAKLMYDGAIGLLAR